MKVSKHGKEYTKLLVLASDGTGNDKFWNVTVFHDLRSILPDALFAKFRYAKFVGKGGPSDYQKKDGTAGVSHDMILSGVEMQNGDYVRVEKSKDGDEDASFP